MTNSYLFKDRAGVVHGYLLKQDIRVSCKVLHLPEDAEIKICEGKTVYSFALPYSSQEQSFALPCKGIDGAVVYVGNHPVYATDWSLPVASKPPETKADCPMETAGSQEKGQSVPETEQPAAYECAGLRWPQRRWPPPPCMPGGRYVNGCWLIASGDAAGLERGAADSCTVSGVDI